MSRDNEKDFSTRPERACLLERPSDVYNSGSYEEKLTAPEKCPLQEARSVVTADGFVPARGSSDLPEVSGYSSDVTASRPAGPPVVEGDPADDDPPPYTVVPPPNHVGWSFDFPSGIPYSVQIGRAPCSTELGLAAFQASLSPTGIRLDPADPIGQDASIFGPLTPYRVDSTPFLYRHVPFSECEPPAKDGPRKFCRYRAILAAAAVIVFLMTLSLLVRFIVENSFWRR